MERRSVNELFAVAVVTATAAMGFSAIVPALPELATLYGVDAAAIGFLQSSVAIPGVLLTPFVGMLSDRLGRRTVLMWALLAFGVLGVGGAFAPNYATLLLLRLGMGVPYAGLLALTPVILTDLFQGPLRVRAIGLNTAALTLASTMGPVVGGLLASGDPRRVFLVYLVAAPALLVARRLRFAVVSGGTSIEPRAVLKDVRATGRLRDLLGAMPYTVVFMAVFVGVSFIVVPVFLESELGIGVAARGPVVGAANLGSALASLGFARIAGRVGPRMLLQCGQGLAVVALLSFAFARGLIAVIIGVLLLGLAIGTTYNTVQVFVTGVSPPARRGVVVGSWSSSSRLGQVLGGSLAGVVVAASGSRQAFVVALVAVLVLAIGWLPLRRLANRAPSVG